MLYEKNPKWVCIFQINLNFFADVFFKLRTNNFFFFWRVQRTKQNCLVLPCCPPDSIMLLAYSFGRRLQIPQPFLIMFNVLLSTEEGDNTRILKWWSNIVMMFSDRFGYLGIWVSFHFPTNIFAKFHQIWQKLKKNLP